MIKIQYIKSVDDNAILPARIDAVDQSDKIVFSLVIDQKNSNFEIVVAETEDSPELSESFNCYMTAYNKFEKIRSVIENHHAAHSKFEQAVEEYNKARAALLKAEGALADVKAGVK